MSQFRSVRRWSTLGCAALICAVLYGHVLRWVISFQYEQTRTGQGREVTNREGQDRTGQARQALVTNATYLIIMGRPGWWRTEQTMSGCNCNTTEEGARGRAGEGGMGLGGQAWLWTVAFATYTDGRGEGWNRHGGAGRDEMPTSPCSAVLFSGYLIL